MNDHESVLLKTTIQNLCTNPDGLYLDCTGGRGGHSTELLSHLSDKGRLWICDYHMESVNYLSQRFADDDRVTVLHSRFSRIFDNLNFSFHGIMADLGISSTQLSDESLGIGFLVENAPLDMRIDSHLTTSAADILQTWSETDLADVFYNFGGEHASRKIAAAIVMDRKKGISYTSTNDLRDLCSRVLGRYYFKKKIHPATKVFQALRIAVNQELEELISLLNTAPTKLLPGGRLAIIAFHSGEDRLVKSHFKELAQTKNFQLVHKKAVKPTDEEIASNPRARSARLRTLQAQPEESK